MLRFWGGLALFFLAGCGTSESSVSVTPVLADTKGTYQLVTSSSSLTSPSGVSTFTSFSSGILRLDTLDYTRVITDHGPKVTSGAYLLGASVNTILNGRHGAFTLTTSDPPFQLTGNYDVAPDFTLTLNYDPFVIPGQGLISLTETWFKESDSPLH